MVHKVQYGQCSTVALMSQGPVKGIVAATVLLAQLHGGAGECSVGMLGNTHNCIHACPHVLTHALMCTHPPTHTHTHTHPHTPTHTHTHPHTHTPTHPHTQTHPLTPTHSHPHPHTPPPPHKLTKYLTTALMTTQSLSNSAFRMTIRGESPPGEPPYFLASNTGKNTQHQTARTKVQMTHHTSI